MTMGLDGKIAVITGGLDPGEFTRTRDVGNTLRGPDAPEEAAKQCTTLTPLHRYARPDEVAGGVAFPPTNDTYRSVYPPILKLKLYLAENWMR